MSWTLPIVAFVVSVGLNCLLVSGRLNGAPLDHPNARSLHQHPVPRAGGIGVVAGIVISMAVLGWNRVNLLCVLAIATLSFVDDRRGLPTKVRFLAHLICASVCVTAILGLERPVVLAIAILSVTWMVNLYNFMDGMDGFAAGMTITGFGAMAGAFALAGRWPMAWMALSASAAALGFLLFNWHPAKIFLGDVGSIPLGLLAGTMGIEGWSGGVWPVWFPIVVFLPFTGDATLTLLRRIVKRERFWEAHRSHAYQRLVLLGWGHVATVTAEYAMMLVCAILAISFIKATLLATVAMLSLLAAVYLALYVGVSLAWQRGAPGKHRDGSAVPPRALRSHQQASATRLREPDTD